MLNWSKKADTDLELCKCRFKFICISVHYKVNQQKSDYYQRNKKEITEKRKIKEKETLLNETEKCEFCGNLFSEAGNLNKHIHSVHGWDSLMEHSRKKKSVDSTIENLEKDKEVEDDSDFKLDKANKN